MPQDLDPIDLQDVMAPAPSNKKHLRNGWTTGSCAAAAAKAEVIKALRGSSPALVDIPLPKGGRATFKVEVDELGRCFVVKDAGDDPDCTDGAHITASCKLISSSPEIQILGGEGVGRVTLSGLGLPIGGPAINPVPQKMIREAIREIYQGGVEVTISVPGGEEMAKKTTNDRLGILGGISILGTTGIVKPFSTASFRAAMVQQIDVASAQGSNKMVLATGSRSEACARSLFPSLSPLVFAEVGDFSGVAFRHCAKVGFRSVEWIGMVGKVTKLAQGMMMTHFHRSNVDTSLLRTVAKQSSANEVIVEAATATNTARHFFEVCLENNELEPLYSLVYLAKERCEEDIATKANIDITMVDLEGKRAVVSTNKELPTLYKEIRRG
jgi:cobalt-precorrin-5B (C1)-methyltransferase